MPLFRDPLWVLCVAIILVARVKPTRSFNACFASISHQSVVIVDADPPQYRPKELEIQRLETRTSKLSNMKHLPMTTMVGQNGTCVYEACQAVKKRQDQMVIRASVSRTTSLLALTDRESLSPHNNCKYFLITAKSV